MLKKVINTIILPAITCLLISPVYSAAANFKLKYQGFLKYSGVPVNGTKGFTFRIKDGSAGGVQWESSCTDITVSSGVFSATLGETNAVGNWNTINWLGIDSHIEVVVGDAGCGNLVTLSPAERLLSNPYGLYASSSTGLQAVSGKIRVESSTVSVNGTDMYLLPPGAIMMWSDILANIPAGWRLCDGTNGTPDLQDRFIYGVNTAEDPGTTGGALNHTHTADAHYHNVILPAFTSGAMTNQSGADNGGAYCCQLARNDGHTHSIAQSSADSTSVSPTMSTESNLPPYYKIAFIMKLY